jgi:undecaprenyl-diphosphatase
MRSGPVPRRAALLAASWTALLLVGWGAGALITSLRPGIDGSLTRSLHGPRTGAVTTIMRVFTWLGSTNWLDAVFAVALLGLLLARAWRSAVFLTLASPGAVGLTQSLKSLVDRHRPYVHHLTSASGPSWPSGHAASTTALYGALLLIAIRTGRLGGKAVAASAVALLLLLALIGLSRVVLGVHYPTDVLAGWLLVGSWLAVLSRVVLLERSRDAALTLSRDSATSLAGRGAGERPR